MDQLQHVKSRIQRLIHLQCAEIKKVAGFDVDEKAELNRMIDAWKSGSITLEQIDREIEDRAE